MKFFFIRVGNCPIEKKKNRLPKTQAYKAKHKPKGKNMVSVQLGSGRALFDRPFTPESSVTALEIFVPYTTYDVITSNGHRQP